MKRIGIVGGGLLGRLAAFILTESGHAVEVYEKTLEFLNKEENLTLQEIGDIFGITRMRICQIEKAALEKLKKKIFAATS